MNSAGRTPDRQGERAPLVESEFELLQPGARGRWPLREIAASTHHLPDRLDDLDRGTIAPPAGHLRGLQQVADGVAELLLTRDLSRGAARRPLVEESGLLTVGVQVAEELALGRCGVVAGTVRIDGPEPRGVPRQPVQVGVRLAVNSAE